jgi:hypothetical protein
MSCDPLAIVAVTVAIASVVLATFLTFASMVP